VQITLSVGTIQSESAISPPMGMRHSGCEDVCVALRKRHILTKHCNILAPFTQSIFGTNICIYQLVFFLGVSV